MVFIIIIPISALFWTPNLLMGVQNKNGGFRVIHMTSAMTSERRADEQIEEMVVTVTGPGPIDLRAS